MTPDDEPRRLGPSWSDEYDQATCAMTGCDEPVRLTRHSSLALFAGSTLADLQGDAHTESWEVGCVAGHVFVLPVDDGSGTHVIDAEALRRIRLSGLGWPSPGGDAQPTHRARRCPEHGIPDCSPLLNGCSRLRSP